MSERVHTMTDILTSCFKAVSDPIFLRGLFCGVGLLVVPQVAVYFYNRKHDHTTPKPSKKIVDDAEEEEEEGESDSDYEDEDSDDDLEDKVPAGEEVKLMLVVRNDLGMGKGKAAAQCAHAAVQAYRQASVHAKNLLQVWFRNGQPKVVVKVNTEEELLKLAAETRSRRLIASLISDAGRTQIQSGSRTVLGIGPAPKSELDRLTGHLKLY